MYNGFRGVLMDFLDKTERDLKLGGGSKVVIVDETHITKKKKNAGGFRGHSTTANHTLVMAGVEGGARG